MNRLRKLRLRFRDDAAFMLKQLRQVIAKVEQQLQVQ